ncbi:MAG: sulfatase-like hydrolase/transferase [Bacillota bacterium]|nr:sulfatase-like hydrolase/transferase [Bacillota bacterium]
MKKKPNLVIIMADQLRYDCVNERYMPTVSRLFADGVHFPRAYCNSPLCAPSRGAFFTGLYPNNNGLLINPWEPTDRSAGAVKAGLPNLYTLLENDWDSWHCGKQHLYTEDRFDLQPDSKTTWTHTQDDYQKDLEDRQVRAPGGVAFRGIVPEMAQGGITRARIYSMPHTGVYSEGLENYFDRYFLRGAKKAIREHDGRRPLLLNMMALAPHPPFDVPEPYASMFQDDELVLPENVGVWSPQQSPLQLYSLTGAGGVRYSRSDWQKIWPSYLGLVRLLDDVVKEIVDELIATSMFEDTLFVFTSDHGEMLGSHRLWQKFCHYEESVRVPMMLKFPDWMDIKPQVIAQAYQHVDFLPTLLDLLDLPHELRLDGRSWATAIQNATPPTATPPTATTPPTTTPPVPDSPIFIQFDGNGALGNFGRAVIDGQFKLIVDLFQNEFFLELYNLQDDPQEMNNLAFDPNYDELLHSLLAMLRQHMNKTQDSQHIPPDALDLFRSRYRPYMIGINGEEYFARA